MSEFTAAPNQLVREREAAGIARPSELAARADIDANEYERIEVGRLMPSPAQLRRLQDALGGVPATRLYGMDMLQIMGAVTDRYSPNDTPEGVRNWVKGPMKLFVARDEVTWWETRRMPDEPVDVFFSLSCGTRAMPHLLLDVTACAKALGIRFVAASGAAGCCGKPVLAQGRAEAGEEFTLSKLTYAESIGATTTVMSCHACQQTAAATMSRRDYFGKSQPSMRQLWTGSFFAEKLEELGDRVPWKREVPRRVLLDWHDDTNGTPDGVMSVVNPAMERLLSLIPGVTVVGRVAGELAEMDICHTGTFDDEQGRPRWVPPENDAGERTAKATRIADLATAQGADTIVCTHFWDHQRWGRYASDRLAVRQAISILAEALGCDHPDRAQAANRIGDPVEVVRQTRAIWSTWGLDEAEALELATNSFYAISGGFTGCSCSVHARQPVIPVDVVRGVAPGLPRAPGIAGHEGTASATRTQ